MNLPSLYIFVLPLQKTKKNVENFMNEFFLIAADYFKGKSIYPSARRFLNLLFNISITSFVYEKFYGHYTWLNYNDYKGMLDFFIRGNFFIPFSIYIVVSAVSEFLGGVVFFAFNHFKILKTTRELIYYQVKKETVDEGIREVTKASKYVAPVRLTKSMMIELYQQARNSITPEIYQQMEEALKLPKQSLEANFIMAFRALIAITIYFTIIPQFGWILYLFVTAILICSMYILMLSFRFLDILPIFIKRMIVLGDEYMKEHKKPNPSTQPIASSVK